jgi:uncharacterized membrane protein YkvA (DUF1232 family)
MALKFVFELSDEDMEYFRRVFEERHRPGTGVEFSIDQLSEAAEQLISQARERHAPPFILDKLEQLRPLVAMVTDREWQLPEPEAQRVKDALVWFADPADLIPDDLPVFGYLDDAMMVDVAVKGLEPELEAFRDFCAFRDHELERRRAAGEKVGEVSRVEWLDARRRELQSRMRSTRQRLFGL